MSYSTAINDNILDISAKAVEKIFSELPNSGSVSTGGANNLGVTLNGTKYVLKNTSAGDHVYNLYDVVAAATAAGYTQEQVYNAVQTGLENTKKYYTTESAYKQWDVTKRPTEGVARQIEYDNVQKIKNTWDTFSQTVKNLQDVSTFNKQTNSVTQSLQTKLKEKYPNLDASVKVNLKPDGSGYIYQITYTDPLTGKPAFTDDIINLSEGNIDNLLNPNQAGIGNALANANTLAKNKQTVNDDNARADWDMADAVQNKLNSVTYANSSNTLTDADKAAITAALPNTDNLTAWNAGKDANIFNTLIKNLQNNNPEVLQRLSLEQLEGIANTVTGEQQKVTERDINNQQSQLLQNIAKDPNLYGSLVQQQRADNAAGTIAGQRATNAQAIASEANAEYDSQAAELYKSLFSGEKGNVAQGTYNDTYSANVAASDQSIQGKIDAIFDAAQKESITIQELGTLLNAVGAAVGVDVSQYADEIAENQAAAGGKATELLERIKSDVNTQIAAGQANIDTIKNLWSEQSSYSSQAKDGSTSIQAPSDALEGYLKTLNLQSGGGYTKVSAGDYKKAERFENQHYDDVVNEEFLNWILSDKTIDSFTKAKTIKEFLGQDLADTLTVEGLKKLYEGYNTEATEQANKVFNQAQRAYIAAITAGDAKTADQLVRLATSASASKGNLFAASALANQFKQQSGLSANGRQLATDFLNQQSFNRMNQAKQATAADAALGKYYYGTGSGDPNQKTVSGAYNIHAQNKATGYDAYGKLGNTLMGYNQDMNSYNVKNSIDNYDRLAQIAAGITGINANAASANKGIQGDKDYLTGAAQAKKDMAEQLNPSLKKNNPTK